MIIGQKHQSFVDHLWVLFYSIRIVVAVHVSTIIWISGLVKLILAIISKPILILTLLNFTMISTRKSMGRIETLFEYR